MSNTAYIGLGSNLDNPLGQVQQAVEEIAQLPETRLLASSRWYRSDAIGPAGQPDYINGAVQIETALTPETLLQQLQNIENAHGRKRTVRWGARTLDLDILLFGDREIDTKTLTIPHRELAHRNFVLYPLADLNPALTLPNGANSDEPLSLNALLENCPATGIVALSESSQ